MPRHTNRKPLKKWKHLALKMDDSPTYPAGAEKLNGSLGHGDLRRYSTPLAKKQNSTTSQKATLIKPPLPNINPPLPNMNPRD